MTASKPGLVKASVVKDVNNIEMGLLDDGTPFLSARGLANLCGVAPATVIQQGRNWLDGRRDGKLAKLLLDRKIARPSLYTPLEDGRIHAYSDDVCMVFLEYYGFELGMKEAADNFRRLAHAGLRLFILAALGHDPSQRIPAQWKKFHDRVMLNNSPRGFFSVFTEMSHFVVTAIQAGLVVDEHTVPDISIGLAWAKYWEKNELATRFGPRCKWPHNFPDYFPQVATDGAWVYPVGVLPVFRDWLTDVYIPEKFPDYLARKVKKNQLPPSAVEMIVAAFEPKELTTAI